MTIRKKFQLNDPRKKRERVCDDIRKELNRLSRKQHQRPLPEGKNRWFFECKIGPGADTARPRPFKELAAAVDEIEKTGAAEVYIEIEVRAITHA